MKKMLIAAAFAVSMVALAGCGANYCGAKPVCAKPVAAPVVCEAAPVAVAPVAAPAVCEAPVKAPKAVCNTCPPRAKKTCNSCKSFKFRMPKFSCNKCGVATPKAVAKCNPCMAAAPSAMNRVAAAQPTCTVLPATTADAPNFSGAGISYAAAK